MFSPLSSIKIRRLIYRTVLLGIDLACVFFALKLAYLTRFEWGPLARLVPPTKGVIPPELYVPLHAASVVVWMAVFAINGFYQRINLPFLDEGLRIAKGVFWGWVLTLAGGFLYRGTDYSRLVSGLSGLYVFGSVFAARELAKFSYARWIARWGSPHRVLVLGRGRLSASIRRVLEAHPELHIENQTAANLGEFQSLLDAGGLREIYVGQPELDPDTLIAMAEASEEAGVPFRIVPDVLELRMGEVILDDSLGLPTFQLRSVSLHGGTYFYKRFFDVSVSIVLMALGIVPLSLLALFIKWDSRGPIFYRQSRVGYKGREFSFLKFRSMEEGADARLEELRAFNERPGPLFKMKADPRVTRVGKWMRKLSLDELPQLLNVLRGEMSLVGPRPQLPKEAESNDRWARKRQNVLPGITGLWQVSGRAHLSYEEMIELDIYYIEHWSPGLDLKILFRTFPAVLGLEGAY